MNGVVHVGSHRGEEIPQYKAEGRSPIICFEPQELCQPPEGVNWVPFALGMMDGIDELYVPNHLTPEEGLDTQSASLLKLIPRRAKANGWTPTSIGKILKVPTISFDHWAEHTGFRFGSCTLLCIDVQGAEMQVLLGARKQLDGFDEIVVECSSPPLYEYGSDARDVVAFLSRSHFKTEDSIPRHGDMHFRHV